MWLALSSYISFLHLKRIFPVEFHHGAQRTRCGYPGVVVGDRAVTEPRNLAHGWIGFDFAAAFGCTVKVINDAAMQALGSYKRGARCSSSASGRASAQP